MSITKYLNIKYFKSNMCLFYSTGAGGTNASSLAVDSPTKGKYVCILVLLIKIRYIQILNFCLQHYCLSWQNNQFIWFWSILWDVERYATFKYYWYWISNKASNHSRIWGAENNRKASSSRSYHWGRCWLSINHLGSSGFKPFALWLDPFQLADKTLNLR